MPPPRSSSRMASSPPLAWYWGRSLPSPCAPGRQRKGYGDTLPRKKPCDRQPRLRARKHAPSAISAPQPTTGGARAKSRRCERCGRLQAWQRWKRHGSMVKEIIVRADEDRRFSHALTNFLEQECVKGVDFSITDKQLFRRFREFWMQAPQCFDHPPLLGHF